MDLDELDIYDDLDTFQQAEDKKSNELLALEAKYNASLKTNEVLQTENADLKKQIKRIGINFQNLLDTAKAEIKRKDKQIENLRKEMDDICFRRKLPKPEYNDVVAASASAHSTFIYNGNHQQRPPMQDYKLMEMELDVPKGTNSNVGYDRDPRMRVDNQKYLQRDIYTEHNVEGDRNREQERECWVKGTFNRKDEDRWRSSKRDYSGSSSRATSHGHGVDRDVREKRDNEKGYERVGGRDPRLGREYGGERKFREDSRKRDYMGRNEERERSKEYERREHERKGHERERREDRDRRGDDVRGRRYERESRTEQRSNSSNSDERSRRPHSQRRSEDKSRHARADQSKTHTSIASRDGANTQKDTNKRNKLVNDDDAASNETTKSTTNKVSKNSDDIKPEQQKAKVTDGSNTAEQAKHNSAANSDKSTEKDILDLNKNPITKAALTKEKLLALEEQLNIKDDDKNTNCAALPTFDGMMTPKKTALFDSLFGSTPSNAENVSSTLLSNVMSMLKNNSESAATSPGNYTDTSEKLMGQMVNCDFKSTDIDECFVLNKGCEQKMTGGVIGQQQQQSKITDLSSISDAVSASKNKVQSNSEQAIERSLGIVNTVTETVNNVGSLTISLLSDDDYFEEVEEIVVKRDAAAEKCEVICYKERTQDSIVRSDKNEIKILENIRLPNIYEIRALQRQQREEAAKQKKLRKEAKEKLKQNATQEMCLIEQPIKDSKINAENVKKSVEKMKTANDNNNSVVVIDIEEMEANKTETNAAGIEANNIDLNSLVVKTNEAEQLCESHSRNEEKNVLCLNNVETSAVNAEQVLKSSKESEKAQTKFNKNIDETEMEMEIDLIAVDDVTAIEITSDEELQSAITATTSKNTANAVTGDIIEMGEAIAFDDDQANIVVTNDEALKSTTTATTTKNAASAVVGDISEMGDQANIIVECLAGSKDSKNDESSSEADTANNSGLVIELSDDDDDAEKVNAVEEQSERSMEMVTVQETKTVNSKTFNSHISTEKAEENAEPRKEDDNQQTEKFAEPRKEDDKQETIVVEEARMNADVNDETVVGKEAERESNDMEIESIKTNEKVYGVVMSKELVKSSQVLAQSAGASNLLNANNNAEDYIENSNSKKLATEEFKNSPQSNKTDKNSPQSNKTHEDLVAKQSDSHKQSVEVSNQIDSNKQSVEDSNQVAAGTENTAIENGTKNLMTQNKSDNAKDVSEKELEDAVAYLVNTLDVENTYYLYEEETKIEQHASEDHKELLSEDKTELLNVQSTTSTNAKSKEEKAEKCENVKHEETNLNPALQAKPQAELSTKIEANQAKQPGVENVKSITENHAELKPTTQVKLKTESISTTQVKLNTELMHATQVKLNTELISTTQVKLNTELIPSTQVKPNTELISTTQVKLNTELIPSTQVKSLTSMPLLTAERNALVDNMKRAEILWKFKIPKLSAKRKRTISEEATNEAIESVANGETIEKAVLKSAESKEKAGQQQQQPMQEGTHHSEIKTAAEEVEAFETHHSEKKTTAKEVKTFETHHSELKTAEKEVKAFESAKIYLMQGAPEIVDLNEVMDEELGLLVVQTPEEKRTLCADREKSERIIKEIDNWARRKVGEIPDIIESALLMENAQAKDVTKAKTKEETKAKEGEEDVGAEANEHNAEAIKTESKRATVECTKDESKKHKALKSKQKLEISEDKLDATTELKLNGEKAAPHLTLHLCEKENEKQLANRTTGGTMLFDEVKTNTAAAAVEVGHLPSKRGKYEKPPAKDKKLTETHAKQKTDTAAQRRAKERKVNESKIQIQEKQMEDTKQKKCGEKQRKANSKQGSTAAGGIGDITIKTDDNGTAKVKGELIASEEKQEMLDDNENLKQKSGERVNETVQRESRSGHAKQQVAKEQTKAKTSVQLQNKRTKEEKTRQERLKREMVEIQAEIVVLEEADTQVKRAKLEIDTKENAVKNTASSSQEHTAENANATKSASTEIHHTAKSASAENTQIHHTPTTTRKRRRQATNKDITSTNNKEESEEVRPLKRRKRKRFEMRIADSDAEQEAEEEKEKMKEKQKEENKEGGKKEEEENKEGKQKKVENNDEKKEVALDAPCQIVPTNPTQLNPPHDAATAHTNKDILAILQNDSANELPLLASCSTSVGGNQTPTALPADVSQDEQYNEIDTRLQLMFASPKVTDRTERVTVTTTTTPTTTPTTSRFSTNLVDYEHVPQAPQQQQQKPQAMLLADAIVAQAQLSPATPPPPPNKQRKSAPTNAFAPTVDFNVSDTCFSDINSPTPMQASSRNVTIDETHCTSMEIDIDMDAQREIDVSANSSTLSDSGSTKHISLGSSDYRFEKVSDNVVNLFITRKRRGKRKPAMAAAAAAAGAITAPASST